MRTPFCTVFLQGLFQPLLREHGFAIFHPDLVGLTGHQAFCARKQNEVFWRLDLIFEVLVFPPHVGCRLLRCVFLVVPHEYHICVLHVHQQVINGGLQILFCFCTMCAET